MTIFTILLWISVGVFLGLSLGLALTSRASIQRQRFLIEQWDRAASELLVCPHHGPNAGRLVPARAFGAVTYEAHLCCDRCGMKLVAPSR